MRFVEVVVKGGWELTEPKMDQTTRYEDWTD